MRRRDRAGVAARSRRRRVAPRRAPRALRACLRRARAPAPPRAEATGGARLDAGAEHDRGDPPRCRRDGARRADHAAGPGHRPTAACSAPPRGFRSVRPDRVVDMPLAEGVIVGSAVGWRAAAVARARDPVPRLRLSRPSTRSGASWRACASVPRAASDAEVIRAPFGGNVRTPELHSDAHEAKYANAPGLKVVMPATARDAKGLLAEAIRGADPVLFCEPLRGYRLIKDDVPDEDYAMPFGRARIAREGRCHAPRLERGGRRCARGRQSSRPPRASPSASLDLRTPRAARRRRARRAVAATAVAPGRPRGAADRRLRRRGGGHASAEAFWSLEAPWCGSRRPTPPTRSPRSSRCTCRAVQRVLAAVRRVMDAE